MFVIECTYVMYARVCMMMFCVEFSLQFDHVVVPAIYPRTQDEGSGQVPKLPEGLCEEPLCLVHWYSQGLNPLGLYVGMSPIAFRPLNWAWGTPVDVNP